MKPILSIIIVSYNTAEITVNCLQSILADKGLKNIPFEIIIIDNNSKDNSVLEIKKFEYSLKIKNYKLKIMNIVYFVPQYLFMWPKMRGQIVDLHRAMWGEGK